MGRSSSSSSSSSDSSSNGNYKRKRSRSSKTSESKRRNESTRKRSYTPPLKDKVGRLEVLVEKLIQHQAEPKPESRRSYAKPECIPEFKPENPNLSSSKWINKVEQLRLVNGWDEQTTIFFMQNRLSGLARRWYDNLPSYQYTWQQWKELLLKSFPDHQDFATTLRALVNRFKQPDESWSRYYFDKMELIGACDISGRKAVSCLIDGIKDSSIQAAAMAGRYEAPDALYAEYLSTLKPETLPEMAAAKSSEHIQSRQVIRTKHFRRPMTERLGEPDTKKLRHSNPQRCYNCREFGHFSNKCPKPKIECVNCKRLGHLAKDCRRKVKNHVTECKQSMTNQNYFFDCWVNETPLQAYVDSGCGAVLIREDSFLSLKLKAEPCTLSILGYGGSSIQTLGKTNIHLKVDSAEANVEALVVPSTAQHIPVLIGQTFLNNKDVVMIVSGKTVRILPSNVDFGEHLDLAPGKVPLWAKSSTVIAPRTTALIAVTSRGAYDGDVYVQDGFRAYPGRENILEACITNAEAGFVTLSNLSDNEIQVSTNNVLARSVRCFEDKAHMFCLSSRIVESSVQNSFSACNVNYNQNLSPVQINSLLDLINEYGQCFAQSTKQLGKTDVLKMSIHLKDDTPVVYRPYRLSHNERQVVRDIVSDLLENNIIRESESPYSSPILLVKKKNGEQRMCVDYRALNAKTVKDRFPLPRVDEFLEGLQGAQYFSSLDFASGYHQIMLEEDSIPKTAFITPDNHYEYLRVLFGLCNAPAIFQRIINRVLGNLRYGKALAFMDDILLPAADFETGITNLRQVFEALRQAGLTLRLSKCNFFMDKVEYLGHEISSEGVQPGKCKTVAVEKFPVPVDVHSVRQFLGLASYFRKYIKDFATIAKPLTILTKKDVLFVWGEEQSIAFNTLKEKLVTRPVLAIYDPQLETEVHTDASKWGIAGILLQKQKNGTLRPVMYYSRQTTKEEQRYHSYELETMAVVYSLKSFRVYLIGIEFKVVTDCNAIRLTLSKRDLVPRIGRWWLAIQEYTFSVEYRPGTKMSHADALSRNPVDSENVMVNVVNVSNSDWVLSAQMGDSRCKYLLEVLSKTPSNAEEKEIHESYSLVNNRLYRNTKDGKKWVVPKAARRQVVLHFHDGGGHMGSDKTLSAISELYWFPGMRRYLKKYLSCCLPCLYNKESGGKKPGFLHPIEKVAVSFDTIHVDHLGPFVKSRRKNSYLIVLVDSFTKFVFMKAVPSTKTKPLISFIDNVIENFGVPRRIISDRGSCYTSKQFEEYCRSMNIKHVLNATATPRANGQVERYNRTILASLSACTEDEERWDESVSTVRWGLNSTMNLSTRKSPYELLFGYSPRSVANSILANEIATDSSKSKDLGAIRAIAKDTLVRQQDKRKAIYDSHRVAGPNYKQGDYVLVRTSVASNEGKSKKLLPKYSGPYEIIKVLDHDRYVIKDVKGSSRSIRRYEGIVSLDKLKAFNVEVSSESNEESDKDEVVQDP